MNSYKIKIQAEIAQISLRSAKQEFALLLADFSGRCPDGKKIIVNPGRAQLLRVFSRNYNNYQKTLNYLDELGFANGHLILEKTDPEKIKKCKVYKLEIRANFNTAQDLGFVKRQLGVLKNSGFFNKINSIKIAPQIRRLF